MLEKYGVEHPAQNPDIFRKMQASSYKRKPYVTHDGKTFMLLGWEDTALDDIFKNEGLKTVFAGEDPEIPTFMYVGDDNKMHHYYPDIYIADENRVIEVKSIYTYNLDPEKTLCKALKVSEDYLFELRLYGGKKELLEVLECRNGIFYSHTQGLLTLGESYVEKKK